jgi:hypothetical protein
MDTILNRHGPGERAELPILNNPSFLYSNWSQLARSRNPGRMENKLYQHLHEVISKIMGDSKEHLQQPPPPLPPLPPFRAGVGAVGGEGEGATAAGGEIERGYLHQCMSRSVWVKVAFWSTGFVVEKCSYYAGAVDVPVCAVIVVILLPLWFSRAQPFRPVLSSTKSQLPS